MRDGFQAIQNQGIIMRAVFIADESLVYQLHSSVAAYDRLGNPHRSTPYAVRGTLFYMFESIPATGTSGFWTPNNYQVGQWYWHDVEVRFGINERTLDNSLVATTMPSRQFWLYSNGVPMDQSVHREFVQPLSVLPR